MFGSEGRRDSSCGTKCGNGVFDGGVGDNEGQNPDNLGRQSSDQRFTKVLAREGVKFVSDSGVTRRWQKPVNQRAELSSEGDWKTSGRKRGRAQSTCGKELSGVAAENVSMAQPSLEMDARDSAGK